MEQRRRDLPRDAVVRAEAGEAREDGRAEDSTAEDEQEQERVPAGADRIRAALERDAPQVVHRILRGEEDAHPGPQRGDDSDSQGEAVSLERVRLDSRADHRQLGERRADDPVLQIGTAVQREAEDRHEDEQQREEREEPVVRDRRGEVAALVVGVLLPDREREPEPRVPLLVAVEGAIPPAEAAHAAGVSRASGR